jgi:hypothetical protein
LSQTVDMPPLESAQPLVAVVTYKAVEAHGIAVGFNRAWKTFPIPSGDWQTERFCLGEAAYGSDVVVRLGSSEKTGDCKLVDPMEATIKIDRLDIVVDDRGECPLPGEVTNGDANREEAGWRFEVLSEDADADFVEGVGREASSGARLLAPGGSLADPSAMTTTVSVPLPSTMPSPALRFWWKGKSGVFFQTELGTFAGLTAAQGRTLGTLVGAGAEQSSIYCLPPWTHGSVVDLSFQISGPGPAEETELVVDALEVVSEPACGDSADVLDPGFESAPTRRTGVSLFGAQEQRFQMVRDGGRAQEGEGFLELKYWTTGASLVFDTWFYVPAPDEQGGPEVTFYSNVPGTPGVDARWVVGQVAEREGVLPRGGGWQLNEAACLPPRWADRWYRFQIWVDPGIGPASLIDPPKSILIDSFEVKTSSKCPSE